MVSSSMHGLDDLGSLYLCESDGMADYATYTTLMLNITHLPTALISGLCLPKTCTNENMEWFNLATTDKINSLMESVQRRLGIFNFTD